MSWETQAWAAKQRPGNSSAKLVLLGMASCADANHCAFPSIKWLCEFGDLDRKTVIEAIKRLSDGMFPLIEDSGERKGRTKQVKVYRLAAASAENASSDPDSGTVPKTEQSQKRNSSVFPSKGYRKRDTEPFKEPIPPLSPNGDKTPTPENENGLKGKKTKRGSRKSKRQGSRLADDWQPPTIDDLSNAALKLVRQWPSGAYEAVCEVFRLHYQSASGPAGVRPNWNAVLSKWIVNDHAKIMRDAKAGVSFAALAPAVMQRNVAGAEPCPVPSKQCEDGTSARIHDLLRRKLGSQIYDQWIANVAVIHEKPGVKVFVGSEFQRAWIDERLKEHIGPAAREATGTAIKWITVEVDQASG